MHLKFFRIFFAPDGGGAGGGGGDGDQPGAAAAGDPGQGGGQQQATAEPAAQAPTSLLSGAGAEEGKAGDGEQKAGEPGSPDDKGEGKKDDKPQGAPEEYADFTLPEGVTANEAAMGEFKALAKELDLPQDKAQKLVDLYSKQATDAAQAPYRLWQETQTQWVDAIKADTEIGGAKLTENLAAAAKAINTFGGEPLRQALDFTGAGNNPAIVKAFVQIGKALGEDGIVHGSPVTPAKSTAEKFYPTNTKES